MTILSVWGKGNRDPDKLLIWKRGPSQELGQGDWALDLSGSHSNTELCVQAEGAQRNQREHRGLARESKEEEKRQGRAMQQHPKSRHPAAAASSLGKDTRTRAAWQREQSGRGGGHSEARMCWNHLLTADMHSRAVFPV